jgi:protein-tyrosine-phosphatase
MSVQIFHSSRQKRELKVLFVSRRDECRAPIAETIFKYLAEKNCDKGFNRFLWRAASAGMEVQPHNQGALPNRMTLRVLSENQMDTTAGARQVSCVKRKVWRKNSLK